MLSDSVQLKFSEPLPALILNGSKNTTWRVNDQRGIKQDSLLLLCYNDGREFARAVVTSTRVINFKELSTADRAGHETFSSEREMYAVYSQYYGFSVTRDSIVKVIKFDLL